MKAKLINEKPEKTFAVIFETGDEFASGLLQFAKDQHLEAAYLTAIGALQRATVGYFDWEKKDYIKIPLDEQMEVLSLIGDIALYQGEPKLHAHCVLGRRDGTTRGGHIFEAHVRPTLEVILTESPAHLRKTYDPALGLALIDLDAS